MKTRIFALGSNGSGQLGIGHQDDTSTPQEVNTDGISTAGIKQIACGGNHTTVLFENGDIATAVRTKRKFDSDLSLNCAQGRERGRKMYLPNPRPSRFPHRIVASGKQLQGMH